MIRIWANFILFKFSYQNNHQVGLNKKKVVLVIGVGLDLATYLCNWYR